MHAGLVLLVVTVGLRVVGFRRLHALLARGKRGPPRTGDNRAVSREARARSTAGAVSAVGSLGPFGATCLSRSLTLWWLLRRQGIESDLRIGVRKQGEGIEAHAWVEIDGSVVSEAGDFWLEYSAFDRAIALPG